MTNFTVHTPEQLAAHDAATSKRYLEALRELQTENARLRAHIRTTPEGFALVPVPEWVKVADGLPVVPEGQYWAKFWVADKRGNIHKIRILAAYSTATIEHDFRGYTHYMYRQDDTPAPPEDL